jgi:subtilisin family serine protease
MKHGTPALAALGLLALAACSGDPTATVAPDASAALARTSDAGTLAINVLLKAPATAEQRTALAQYGPLKGEIAELNAVTMRVKAGDLAAVQALPFVAAAGADQARQGAPTDAVSLTTFASSGVSSWDQDAINVTDRPSPSDSPGGRVIDQTGEGVYVGVLDTGLLDSWREYFPQERIATQYAASFGGGGGEAGNVSMQPNKWEHDQDAHGTHVTSSILGFRLNNTTSVNGTAPNATVIPVKVLGQNGSGWSSVIAAGIVYIAKLKEGPLAGKPVVINMSLGGSRLDAVEKQAIDYAVGKGVIIVAAAGNSGERGMGYPGAYAPVISVASAAWTNLFNASLNPLGWRGDVVENDLSQFTVSGFSSRATRPEHDLDVTAPGSNVVGPYQLNSGQNAYYYLSGTSMASPHVAGIVALMAQKQPLLTPTQAEDILESVARLIPGFAARDQGKGFVTADAAVNATN